MLLVIIPIICLIISFLHHLTPKIVSWIITESISELNLQTEINELKAKQNQLSMRENYVEYVQLDRQLNNRKTILGKMKSQNHSKKLILNYSISFGSKLLFSFTLLVISIVYRASPVVTFDDQFNFTPFSALIRFPTGIDGAVSVPFWIFINSYVSKHVASYF